MTAEEVAVALSPFGQVSSGLSRRHEGAGLGLPLAQQLSRLHGGELKVDSRPEIGTTVAVTLPSGRVMSAPDGSTGAVAAGCARGD